LVGWNRGMLMSFFAYVFKASISDPAQTMGCGTVPELIISRFRFLHFISGFFFVEDDTVLVQFFQHRFIDLRQDRNVETCEFYFI
jgi:hypothetical protein